MSSAGPAVVVAGLAALLSLGAGCATPVTLRTEAPYAHVVVDGTDRGAIDDRGVKVDVPAGAAPIAWQLLDDKNEVMLSGTTARTELRPEIVAVAVSGAFCCVPTLAFAGCCAANPALLAGSLGCLLGNIGGLVAAVQAPGWLSIPFGCVGAAAGASPLALGMIGLAPPVDVILKAEQPPAAPATAAVAQQEVPW